MRINPINFSTKHITPKRTYFCGNTEASGKTAYYPILRAGQIIDPATKGVFNRNTTCYFRNDLNWRDFGKYIEEKFSDYDKVNTYIWGCSDGHEAYSLSMLSDFIKDGSKLYPIKAMDIMPYIISTNKKRQKTETFLDTFDFERIRSAIGFWDVKKVVEAPPPWIAGRVKIKDEVKKRVEFSRSNIVTDMDKIDSSAPSIVMCRNMWPYIDSDFYDDCAKTLYNHLKEGSIVVIGKFDLNGDYRILGSDNFPYSLTKAGFKPVDRAQGKVDNYMVNCKPCLIYEKPKNC